MTRPALFSLVLVLAGCGPRHAALPANVVAEFPLGEASIGELQAAMTSGSTTSKEITAAFLDRIDALDRQGPELRAMNEPSARL